MDGFLPRDFKDIFVLLPNGLLGGDNCLILGKKVHPTFFKMRGHCSVIQTLELPMKLDFS